MIFGVFGVCGRFCSSFVPGSFFTCRTRQRDIRNGELLPGTRIKAWDLSKTSPREIPYPMDRVSSTGVSSQEFSLGTRIRPWDLSKTIPRAIPYRMHQSASIFTSSRANFKQNTF